MSFKELQFPRTKTYKSFDDEWPPVRFYNEVLPRACKIDMLLGYFSTNAIRGLAYGFAKFIYNNGVLRLAVNSQMSSDDKENLLVNTAVQNRDYIIDVFSDLTSLKNELGLHGQYFFDCLKYLMECDRLEIVPIAEKPNHDKEVDLPFI